MKLYAVRDREAGNIIEIAFTKEAAEKTLHNFEESDKEEGIFEEGFYEIAVTDADFRGVE